MRLLHRSSVFTATALALLLAACGADRAARTPLLRVVSSISSGAVLSNALVWTAVAVGVAPTGVGAVQFLIAGRVRWIEHSPPYVFDGDGGELFPWLLGSGPHRLAVRVMSADGHSASTAAPVTVTAEPPVPRALVGSFVRTVTPGDVRRTARFRREPADEVLPAGRWRIEIAATGVISFDDPRGSGGNEAFVASSGGMLTLEGPANWLLPLARQGGFCETEPTGSYGWTGTGRTLGLRAVRDPCADRNSMFDGDWTRI
jgi:hypothetical protein